MHLLRKTKQNKSYIIIAAVVTLEKIHPSLHDYICIQNKWVL